MKLAGNWDTKKSSMYSLVVTKCRNNKNNNIKCASDNEMKEKMKYIHFTLYEN